MSSFNLINTYAARFFGVRLKHLSIPHINRHMRNALLRFVNAGIARFARTLVRHEEHKIARLQLAPIRRRLAHFLYEIPLFAGIGRQGLPDPIHKGASYEAGAIERAGAVSRSTELIWRAQVFFTGLDYAACDFLTA